MFIWKKEIVTITWPTVTFKDWSKETFSEIMLKHIQTKEPLDPTSLRELRCQPIVKELIEILLRYNVYTSELDFICWILLGSINETKEQALNKLYWVESTFAIPLQKVDEVLKN